VREVHCWRIADVTAWQLAGSRKHEKRSMLQKPRPRRDSGNLISEMRIPEYGSQGIPRLCSGSQANRKSKVSRGTGSRVVSLLRHPRYRPQYGDHVQIRATPRTGTHGLVVSFRRDQIEKTIGWLWFQVDGKRLRGSVLRGCPPWDRRCQARHSQT